MRETEAGRGLRAIPGLTPTVGPWSLRVRLGDGQTREATPLERILGRARSRWTSAAVAAVLVAALSLVAPLAAGVAAAVAGGAMIALTFFGRRRRSVRDRAAEGDRRYRTLLDHLPLVTVVNRESDLEQLYVSAQIER